MSRIPSHTVEDAPEASRALLHEMIRFSPTGRPLNRHAPIAYFFNYAGTGLDLPARV